MARAKRAAGMAKAEGRRAARVCGVRRLRESRRTPTSASRMRGAGAGPGTGLPKLSQASCRYQKAPAATARVSSSTAPRSPATSCPSRRCALMRRSLRIPYASRLQLRDGHRDTPDSGGAHSDGIGRLTASVFSLHFDGRKTKRGVGLVGAERLGPGPLLPSPWPSERLPHSRR